MTVLCVRNLEGCFVVDFNVKISSLWAESSDRLTNSCVFKHEHNDSSSAASCHTETTHVCIKKFSLVIKYLKWKQTKHSQKYLFSSFLFGMTWTLRGRVSSGPRLLSGPQLNPIIEDSTFFIWHIQSYTSTTCSEMCADTLLRCAKHG